MPWVPKRVVAARMGWVVGLVAMEVRKAKRSGERFSVVLNQSAEGAGRVKVSFLVSIASCCGSAGHVLIDCCGARCANEYVRFLSRGKGLDAGETDPGRA
jgi:hypothetical protein